MKRKNLIAFCVLVFTMLSLATSNPALSTTIGSVKSKASTAGTLTIYTYDSLMADPYYDIEGNFSAYAGINKNNINIQRFSDANELVSRLVSEKSNPQADVVIGIDNALKFLSNLSDLLIPYDNATVLSNIDSNLITNLDVNQYLVPYDFGIISFYYNTQLVNASTYPVLNNLTFDNLLSSPLLSKIVTENPKISSTGLGFLLWTIAYYGDPSANVSGLTGRDWTKFWNNGGNSINMTQSWGDAFTVFADPSTDKPVMVSYTTSPAYDSCISGDNSTSASVTTYNGKDYGWYQIEGAGLVKKQDTTNLPLAKEFMDWFLSTNTQNEIPESQWMYPANTKAQIPACFSQVALDPSKVSSLNNILTPSHLRAFLNPWINEWEQIEVTQNLPGFTDLMIFLPILALVIFRKKSTSN